MKEIKIKLNEKYKSFDSGFVTFLSGELIILSGVNGSGKSQFLNIIYGQEGKDVRKKIKSSILIDDKSINIIDIDIRSFKDNTNIPEITSSTSQSVMKSARAAYSEYGKSKLDPLKMENSEYADSCKIARKILQDGLGVAKFDSWKITENEAVEKLLEKNFIWRGDRFANSIGEIFFNHCLKVNEMIMEVGRKNYDSSILEDAPWDILNELFSKMNLEYRFKDDYFIKGVEINEQPKIFAIDTNGNINERESRELADLSDGEKTIISLCFASLIGSDLSEKKLLLLDEVDSILNPSLTQMFFEVINEFFIKKGIMVIISTHSATTISLSPDYTKFYEIFKPNKKGVRVLEVSKNDYTELLIANKNFYDKISNQENRIIELEKKITSNQDVLIVTEGKTDWKYFISALRYFHTNGRFTEIKEEYFYRFGSSQDVAEGLCDTSEVNELSETKLKNYLMGLIESRSIDKNDLQIRIGIFDSDTSISMVNDSSKKIYSFKINPQGISTEFLFSDEEIKTNIDNKRLFIGEEFDARNKIHNLDSSLNLGGDNPVLNKAGKRTIIESDVYDRDKNNVALSKEKFAQAVYQNNVSISEKSWNNFKQIFEQISEILPKETKVASLA